MLLQVTITTRHGNFSLFNWHFNLWFCRFMTHPITNPCQPAEDPRALEPRGSSWVIRGFRCGEVERLPWREECCLRYERMRWNGRHMESLPLWYHGRLVVRGLPNPIHSNPIPLQPGRICKRKLPKLHAESPSDKSRSWDATLTSNGPPRTSDDTEPSAGGIKVRDFSRACTMCDHASSVSWQVCFENGPKFKVMMRSKTPTLLKGQQVDKRWTKHFNINEQRRYMASEIQQSEAL